MIALLYDMAVRGLGPLRVAEHFTVADGTITRIRQAHDTAAIRAAARPGGFARRADRGAGDPDRPGAAGPARPW